MITVGRRLSIRRKYIFEDFEFATEGDLQKQNGRNGFKISNFSWILGLNSFDVIIRCKTYVIGCQSLWLAWSRNIESGSWNNTFFYILLMTNNKAQFRSGVKPRSTVIGHPSDMIPEMVHHGCIFWEGATPKEYCMRAVTNCGSFVWGGWHKPGLYYLGG